MVYLHIVFHFLNHPSFLFGWSPSATVTPLGLVGVHELDTLVFLFGCKVGVDFRHLLGGDAVLDDSLHLHYLVELVNLQ